jgi:acylphosphatase
MATLHFRIHGQVQGVWFRGWTRDQARKLGLAGWVRNLPDGTVEGLAQGPEEAVNELAARLADGPPHARVERVELTPWPPDTELTGFDIRRSSLPFWD